MDEEKRDGVIESMVSELSASTNSTIRANARYEGYRVGLQDAFLFSFMLVLSAVTIFCWMKKED